MALNESYPHTRAQILMMDPFPNITKVYALVIQEECLCSCHHDLVVPSEALTISESGSTIHESSPTIALLFLKPLKTLSFAVTVRKQAI